MFTLDGIALNPSMVWRERYQSQYVAQEVKRTLTGRAVVYAAPLIGGIPITLEATEEYGWLTKAQGDAILALSEMPGAIYSLVYQGVISSVVFRHNDPPAVELVPLIYRMNAQDEDYLIGVIKLLVV